MTLHLGNCLDVMKTMPDNSIDSIVCDPPYGLSFMGKRWDYDVPSIEIWAECLRVLKPGGHLLAFAGTRTQHRMAVRIEDAGFEIRDMLAWVYGSGFPKSLDVSKAIDKSSGATPIDTGIPSARHNSHDRGSENSVGFQGGIPNITAPATEAAKQWQGWGTALKPALEPITMARKPLIGTVASNVEAYGTGGLNIDGCRIEGSPRNPGFKQPESAGIWNGSDNSNLVGYESPSGRWPANLLHDGSDEVVALFPQSNGQMADASLSAEGRKTSNAYGAMKRGNGRDGEPSAGRRYAEEGATDFAPLPGQRRGDSGSAARFFYCAKADRGDRNDGLQDPGTQFAHCAMLRHAENVNVAQRGNHHPTVKPTELMRWLCRLITPPGGTVLDPFMGSGSTGRGATLEGFEFIGIEMDPGYLAIAESRIAVSVEQRRIDTAQLDMFGERQIA